MITITMEGGVIQYISGIPAGHKVRVLDFDTDGVPPENLTSLPNGDVAVVSTWPSRAKKRQVKRARN